MQLFIPLLGYLVGAIPFGLLIGRMAGVDVREAGSKNIGATNVNRLLGKKLGLLTLLCDCLKGFLPVAATAFLLGGDSSSELLVPLTGLCAVVGHMFPVYLGFKGGKGVATGLGVFLYLSPLATFFCLIVFVASVAISGFVSVGSLLGSGVMFIWLLLFGAPKASVVCALIVAVLIWIQHRQNISRLLSGDEKSWKKEKS